MKKFIITFSALTFWGLVLLAQNQLTPEQREARRLANLATKVPWRTHYSDLVPIDDLGKGYCRGLQGGLYPNGSNVCPEPHLSEGIAIAKSIQPLNAEGNIDEANGKIVWIAIGNSNTTMETTTFINMFKDDQRLNPKLVLLDLAFGGKGIPNQIDPDTDYWKMAMERLAQNRITPEQVQVIWFKTTLPNPNDTVPGNHAIDTLKNLIIQSIHTICKKFPNTKLLYQTSRTYAGYATQKANPEPYAWLTGFSVKRMIEDQLKGVPDLAWKGANAKVPWMAWGPYIWTNGMTPRKSDGLVWEPDDTTEDGFHPATTGKEKVAKMMFKFFSTDPTCTPWFLKK